MATHRQSGDLPATFYALTTIRILVDIGTHGLQVKNRSGAASPSCPGACLSVQWCRSVCRRSAEVLLMEAVTLPASAGVTPIKRVKI
jgi:hypothetical protein